MGSTDEILSTRVSIEVANKIKALAKNEHRNISNMIAVLIEDGIKSRK